MSPLILVYILLIALVVGGLFVAMMTYRAKRSARDTTGGVPRATRPRAGGRPPRTPR